MKLLRYGLKGEEKPGLLDRQGDVRDLSSIIPDISRETLSSEILKKIAEKDPYSLPLIKSKPRIGPCVSNVGNYFCVGLNYFDHAEEMGLPQPSEPVIFSKATSAITGPYDDILIPLNAKKTDWEVELGIVIGKYAKRVPIHLAFEYIAGFCLLNDISERHLQMEGTGQWIKGKSAETFAPIGPWLVTLDEIRDVQNLEIWLEIDGKRYQESNTHNMIFSVPYLISYLSSFFILQPGDIIATGTPSGVGLGQKPVPIFLQEGQIMRLGITGLGEQCHTIIAET